jgi:hypothetical protein
MNTIKEVKLNAAQLVADAVTDRVRSLITNQNTKSLGKQFKDFENDCYNTKKYNYRFDEFGSLSAVMVLDLPDWLKSEDTDVIEELLGHFADCGYVYFDKYSKEWVAEQGLGECTIINWNAGRYEYTIYSEELKLKIERVIDETHAYLLIEQAMRKAGYFGNIVSVDSQGQFIEFVDTKMGRLKDTTIEKRLKKYEGQ